MKRLIVSFALASAGVSAQIPGAVEAQSLAEEAQAVKQVDSISKTLPASGSPDAARLACIRFINLMFGVPNEKIDAVVLESTSTLALVRARYPSQQCTLTLVKSATANEYGWTVKNYECQGMS